MPKTASNPISKPAASNIEMLTVVLSIHSLPLTNTHSLQCSYKAGDADRSHLLDATEKAGEGHPSNLPESKSGHYIALPEILRSYYGYWLGGMWARCGQDVEDLGAGG